jgi:hypothetical protein
MQKKHFGFVIAGVLALVMVMMLSMNTMAAYQSQGDSIDMPFKTDMSDRTMLKEILVNQQKTLSLLNEIKAAVKEKR